MQKIARAAKGSLFDAGSDDGSAGERVPRCGRWIYKEKNFFQTMKTPLCSTTEGSFLTEYYELD